MIPKKIYFTYKTETPPEFYIKNLKIWNTFCPGWEIHYFSDTQIYNFFEKYFPSYFKDLSKISIGVVLADLFRYGILYVQGGMYTDIDTVPIKKIPESWRSYQAVIGYERQPVKFPEAFRNFHGQKDVFCQWSFLSSPKNILFKELLDESFRRLRRKNFRLQTKEEVYNATGPLIFSSIVEKYKYRPEVLILDIDYFASSQTVGFLTKRSVVKHFFHGHNRWKRELDVPQIRFY